MGHKDNSGFPMAFQHANNITQVEAPSSTTIQKMFLSIILWHTPLLSEKRHREEDKVYNL
jgi:hypothetical protein